MTLHTSALLYNPFIHAPLLLSKFRTNQTLVVSDYDKTQTTGSLHPGEQELSDREAGVRIAEEHGAVLACITARTPGLAMSRRRYLESVALGYTEPPPRWHRDPVTRKFVEVDPAEEPFFRHNYDWPIIGSFGRGLLVQNGVGYRVDKGYEQMLDADVTNPDNTVRKTVVAPSRFDREPVKETETPSPWRLAVMGFIYDHLQFALDNLADIEIGKKYYDGETNVAPLPYRVQFNFFGPKGYKRMVEIKRVLKEKKQANDPLARRLFTVDESRLNADPDKREYVLYFVPWCGRKENMFNRMLSQMVQASGILPQGVQQAEVVAAAYRSIKLFYAGDSPTDLRIGLLGGGSAQTHFLLPTGSDLAPIIMARGKRYGVVDLSMLWEDPTKKRLNPRLVPTGRTGEYRFVHKVQKMMGHSSNIVVIADERYPNRTPPGSVAEFLSEYLRNPSAG